MMIVYLSLILKTHRTNQNLTIAKIRNKNFQVKL